MLWILKQGWDIKKKRTSYGLLSGIFLSTLSQTYSIYLHILDNTWWSGECQTLLQLYNSSGVVGNFGLRGKRPVWQKWANISMYLNAVRSYYPHLSKKGQCRGSTLLFALAQQEHQSCTNPANTSWTYIKKPSFQTHLKTTTVQTIDWFMFLLLWQRVCLVW